jgi:hypothetical protein
MVVDPFIARATDAKNYFSTVRGQLSTLKATLISDYNEDLGNELANVITDCESGILLAAQIETRLTQVKTWYEALPK